MGHNDSSKRQADLHNLIESLSDLSLKPSAAPDANESSSRQVIRLSNIPAHFCDPEIRKILKEKVPIEFSIKWQSKTSALLVFKDGSIAKEKADHIIESMSASKITAYLEEESKMASLRPKRTALVANRLVASALGLSNSPQVKKIQSLEKSKLEGALKKE